ncbi:40S ribosomal protein S10 [Heterostelium album PN500]|uniref:40S ribosomal protein S10 n=1 Tax=Heterostelium pallidum (strain ATCC 26659 / Pp 5 / PN500) TaxID=670386 RepID=D3BKE3_HETP5|nr:40S ribosomal protein S10 [Heterostelium album PN500]EFA78373.1 40S ribosomal protein S10 [Heterostelium album PN500]|eukprot:XP_020430498.1 40S ribosomal protein S10 [Heterostelium album PN500]
MTIDYILLHIYLETQKQQKGVLVAKKDFGAKTHPNVEGVTNLEVLACMKSLKSRAHVTEIFNWQYYYFTLTDQGIQYLRQFLQLPESVVPSTLRKPASRPVERRERSDRHEDGKRMGPSGEFTPGFRGGDRPRRGGMGSSGYRRREEGSAPRPTQSN